MFWGKFKKLGRISIRDMENYIFTVSQSSTVEKESRFVKESLKLGIASYSSPSASPRDWKIAIPRLRLSFTHRDSFCTVEDRETVKNYYYLIPAENFAPGAENVLRWLNRRIIF